MAQTPLESGDADATVKPTDQELRLSKGDPLAQTLTEAIHAGAVESLNELLRDHPGLASARVVDAKVDQARRCTS